MRLILFYEEEDIFRSSNELQCTNWERATTFDQFMSFICVTSALFLYNISPPPHSSPFSANYAISALNGGETGTNLDPEGERRADSHRSIGIERLQTPKGLPGEHLVGYAVAPAAGNPPCRFVRCWRKIAVLFLIFASLLCSYRRSERASTFAPFHRDCGSNDVSIRR